MNGNIKNCPIEHRILEGFLENPEKRSTFKDVRLELKEYSETHIRDTLSKLEKSNILETRYRRGRPKGGNRLKEYTIFKELKTFRSLLGLYSNENCENLINSNYTNELIKKYKFIEIVNVIKLYFDNYTFKKISTECLLKHSATIKEYDGYPAILKEMDEYLIEGRVTPYSDQKDVIKVLSILDPLNAVEFYRNKINITYPLLFREVTSDDPIMNKSIQEFVDYDILLSPFSSYPVNDLAELLFNRPFERIYNDAFILNMFDYEKFILRAYHIYTHFSDILTFAIKSLSRDEIYLLDHQLIELDKEEIYGDPDFLIFREESRKYKYNYIQRRWDYLHDLEHNLTNIIKLSVYYWNIASTQFDVINNYIYGMAKKKFRIFQDNGIINIVDLESGKLMLRPNYMRERAGNISILSGSDDPFQELWPCDVFYEIDPDLKTVTYADILEKIKLNF